MLIHDRHLPTDRAAYVLFAILMFATLLMAFREPRAASAQDNTGLSYTELCSKGIVVPDPENNPGQVQDCAVLLEGQATLEADPPLNWSPSIYINDWDGVNVYDLPRVENLTIVGNDGPITLHGEIPPSFGGLTALKALYFNSNELTGTIPPELANLSNLNVLWLNFNNLSGPIPIILPNVSTLSLRANEFTGGVPTEISTLSKLRDLDLSSNRLSGSFPTHLANLPNLIVLNLGYNFFAGPLPTEYAFIPNLQEFTLSGNLFTGSFPIEYTTIANLKILNLNARPPGSINPPVVGYLSGMIPSEIGNLTNLQRLRIRYNNFTGSIPAELGDLPLDMLILQGNQFAGRIPAALRDVRATDLEHVDLPYCDEVVPTPVPPSTPVPMPAPTRTPVFIVLGPVLPNQMVTLAWPDGETVSIELRIQDDLPSYVSGSIAISHDVTYTIDPWGANPRKSTFTRADHGQIQIIWSVTGDMVTPTPPRPAPHLPPGTECWEGHTVVAQTVLASVVPGHYGDLDSIASQLPGGRVIQVNFGGKIMLISFDGTRITLSGAIAMLAADARVRYAEPNYLVGVDGPAACGPETKTWKPG